MVDYVLLIANKKEDFKKMRKSGEAIVLNHNIYNHHITNSIFPTCFAIIGWL